MASARYTLSGESEESQSSCSAPGLQIRQMPRLAYSRLFSERKARNRRRGPTSNPQPNSTTSHDEHNRHSPTCLISRVVNPSNAPPSFIPRQGLVRIRPVVVEPYDGLFSQLWNDEQPGPTPSEQLWENVNARRPSRNVLDTRPLRTQKDDARTAPEQLGINRRAIVASQASHRLLDGISRAAIPRYTSQEADAYSPDSAIFITTPSLSGELTEPPAYCADTSPPAYSHTEITDDFDPI